MECHEPATAAGVLLMTVAVVGAAAVFVMVLGYVNQVRSEVGRMTGVLQLQSEVEPFQPIQDGMLRRVQVPEKYLPATFIADPAEIQGKVAASVLPKGAYLQQGMLSDAPDLKPGQREIAITIDAETGVAGKVYPGAIVDVYATFSGGNSASCAVRVLNRVQIIDVGQLRTEQGKEAGWRRRHGRPGDVRAGSGRDAQPDLRRELRREGAAGAGRRAERRETADQPALQDAQGRAMSFEIFIGAADHELVTGLRTQVEELPDVRIAGVETTSAALIGLVAGEPQLDAVLIDERLGPLPARDLIRELALARPHLAVVMIAETASADVLALAMEVGARGVLSRRPSLEELRSRIASAAQWTRSMRPSPDGPPGAALSSRRGEILAVSGGKGGTGTTTLAVHLALSAVGPGRSVCLVDLDLQAGDVPAYLDLAHRRSIADLAEAAGDIGGSMLAETLYVHPAGPHILLAPADGERADDVTGQTARLVLGALRARYDLVVVDCGTLMTAASITGVELADRVLVTVTPDLPALRGAKRLAGLWERLDVRNPEDVTAVLVRHSRKNEIQPDLARKILGIPLSDVTVPAAFRALEEAANTGAPGAVTDGGFRRAVQRLAADAAPAVKETA